MSLAAQKLRSRGSSGVTRGVTEVTPLEGNHGATSDKGLRSIERSLSVVPSECWYCTNARSMGDLASAANQQLIVAKSLTPSTSLSSPRMCLVSPSDKYA